MATTTMATVNSRNSRCNTTSSHQNNAMAIQLNVDCQPQKRNAATLNAGHETIIVSVTRRCRDASCLPPDHVLVCRIANLPIWSRQQGLTRQRNAIEVEKKGLEKSLETLQNVADVLHLRPPQSFLAAALNVRDEILGGIDGCEAAFAAIATLVIRRSSNGVHSQLGNRGGLLSCIRTK
jgi:hypothetical protein